MLGSSIAMAGSNPLASTAAVDILDDILLTLGDGSDQVLLNRSATLTTNTALTGVLIGTPVTPALAANSLIIANTTADGDVLIVGNDGGHSRVAMFFDSSTPDTYLYNVGGTWTAGATAWTLPAFTLGGTVTLGSNVFDAGAVNAQIISTGTQKGLTITATNAGAIGAMLAGLHQPTTQAVDDIIFMLAAVGRDTGGTARTSHYIDMMVEAVEASSLTSKFRWRTVIGNIANIAMTLSSAGALWSDLSMDTLTYKVSGTQVVGARVVDARCDDVVDNTYGAEEAGVLDALRDAMIAHGLISAA